DIYAAGSESRPPMLNKENYVSWSSRLLWYAKNRPNGKLIHNSILNEWSQHVTIVHQTKDLHTADYTQLYDFLKYNQKEVDEVKLERLAKIQDPLALMANSNNPYASPAPHQDLSPFNQNYMQQPMANPEDITDPTTIEADDQAIQTILLSLPEGIYEKKAKLFNEWERFTSNEGESIESYYHRFLKLMNDLKRNKHFPEKIASNLKFLNNLQLEWSQHVTIVHQTKDLHTADYTQLYDFLKYNQKEVDEVKVE
nr:Gag-Pol polyprotein [Tanacetum cinerariifolium]